MWQLGEPHNLNSCILPFCSCPQYSQSQARSSLLPGCVLNSAFVFSILEKIHSCHACWEHSGPGHPGRHWGCTSGSGLMLRASADERGGDGYRIEEHARLMKGSNKPASVPGAGVEVGLGDHTQESTAVCPARPLRVQHGDTWVPDSALRLLLPLLLLSSRPS